MSRRLAAVAVALVLLALVAGGALGGVFASDSTGSGLMIDAADGPNGDYADLSGDTLELDLSEGGGVSNDAITHLDAVFVVTNDRSYEAPVWVSDDSSALSFYDTDTGERVDTRDNAKNLTAGESLRVGVAVDMRDTDAQEVESTSEFVVETLVADTTDDGNDPSDAPDSSDTPDPSDAPDDEDPTDAPDGENSTTDSGSTTDEGGDSTTDSGGDSTNDGGRDTGGQSSRSSESSYRVYDTNEGATVNVDEAFASDPFTADLTGDDGASYVAGDEIDVTAFSADPTFDREDWRVEVTNPTAEPQDAPRVDGEAVGYFRADAYGAEASAFERLDVNASVSIPDDTAPEDVTLYRHTGGGWERVETTHRGGERFGAAVNGFGEFAVVVEASDTEPEGTDDGTDSSTDTETDGTGGADGTDSGDGPGATRTDGGATDSNDTATAIEQQQKPLPLDSGLGESTVIVFGVFSLWLAARGRVGRGGGGL